jgi:purine-binding chemotaxis protein CheW
VGACGRHLPVRLTRRRSAGTVRRPCGGEVLACRAVCIASGSRNPPPDLRSRSVKRSAPTVPHRALVTFRVGASELALDVAAVHEVLRVPTVAPVPKAPSFVAGVIELRGALLPVVDLRRRLEVEASAPQGDARVLVVETGGERLGLLVDRVNEVLHAPESAIHPPARFLRGRSAVALQGLVQLPERLILLLELDRVLSSDERIALRDLEAAIEDALRSAHDEALPDEEAGTQAAPDERAQAGGGA